MKASILSLATFYFAASPTFARTRTTNFNTRGRELKPEKSYAKPAPPSPQKSYYAPPAHTIVHTPVYYAPAPPPRPPAKLVQAKVLTEKAKFLVFTESTYVEGFVKLTQGISSEVKAAASLIAEAKVKLEYGHKDYSCDLVELSESLIAAAGSQTVVSGSSISLVLEKIKMAISKVEAHIKWLSSQYGYDYTHTDKSVNAILEALMLVVEKAEAAMAAGLEIFSSVSAAQEAAAAADDALKEALKYCVDDSSYGYNDEYGLVAYFKKALMTAADAVATFDAAIDALVALFISYDENFQLELEEAVAAALQSIIDAIAPKKGYY